MIGAPYNPDNCIFIASQVLNADQFNPNVPDDGNISTHNMLWDAVAGSLIWVDTKTNLIALEIKGSTGSGTFPFGTDTGVVNAVQVAIPGATLTDGYIFEVKIENTNTGASTLQINALGIKPIVDADGNPLLAGTMQAGIIYLFSYNTTSSSYQLLGESKPTEWSLNGNTVGAEKSIGTLDNFDFPIIVNGIEVTRITKDLRQFWNDTKTNNGSNAGLQYSSLIANRAQLRNNQYGANNAGAGITTFKSRGLVIGAPLSLGDGLIVGDIVQGFTAIGVTGNGLLIPLLFTQRVTVAQSNPTSLATDWTIQLCPLNGITNSIRNVFRVTSEGIQAVRETVNCMAGVVVLDAAGQFVVPNTNVKANTKFLLTVQDGGPAPVGNMYQSARTIGVDFTIKSNAGVADAGVQVYYQLYEPLV